MPKKTFTPSPKLGALWRTLDTKQRERFASLAGTTAGSLRHVVEGRRGISAELAVKLEKAAIRIGVAMISRTELNAACSKCEFARACLARKDLA